MTWDELRQLVAAPTASVKETAAAIDFSEKTVRKRIRDGEIPSISLGRRKIRVPTSWIAQKLGVSEAA
jgi:excisionase family DNA binding protein